MTTVADFGEYTGIMGTVTIGGVPLADVEYDLKWERTTVSHQRSGKRSAINIPGSLKVSTTVKKALVRTDAPTVIGYTLTDTPGSGTAVTLLATSTVLDASTNYDAMTDPTKPGTASKVRLTLQTKNVTATGGGTVTLIGTDVNDLPQTDILTIPDGMIIGEFVDSAKAFKTVAAMVTVDVDSTGDTGTFKVESLAGTATYTVGDPEIFDLVGTLTKGAHTLVFTQPDCWFSNGGINWTNGDEIIEVNLNVEMHDPDLLTVAET